MTEWLAVVLVLGFAAYRATRIVTTDSISERARERLYRWAWVEADEPEAYGSAWLRWRESENMLDVPVAERAPLPRRGGFRTYVSELFQCPWCLGVWISFAALAVYWWGVADGDGSISWFVLVGLAVAGVQGFVASRNSA